MKKTCCLAVVIFVFWGMAFPEQASAQLFRRPQENSSRNNFSNLPGADPTARRAADYGAEQVSEEIRNEVNGRSPMRPAPDFRTETPLTLAAKRFQLPTDYIVQRPIVQNDGSRVQPPMTKYSRRNGTGPSWMADYLPESDISNLPPQTSQE